MAAPTDVAEARKAAAVFVEQLRKKEPPEILLHLFAPEAFDNPVTRQITGLTGGDFNAPPAQIRSYVVQTLQEVRGLPHNANAKCPDPALVRNSLETSLKPDNDLDTDDFSLKIVDRATLRVLSESAEQSELQFRWLRQKINGGRRLALMIVACNDVPLYMVWQRMPSGKWMIVAFAAAVQ